METFNFVKQLSINEFKNIFNSNYFQIRLHRALRQNQRFNETNSCYEINFRNVPNNYNTL